MLYHTEEECSIKLEAISSKLENMKKHMFGPDNVYVIEDIQALVNELIREIAKHEE